MARLHSRLAVLDKRMRPSAWPPALLGLAALFSCHVFTGLASSIKSYMEELPWLKDATVKDVGTGQEILNCSRSTEAVLMRLPPGQIVSLNVPSPAPLNASSLSSGVIGFVGQYDELGRPSMFDANMKSELTASEVHWLGGRTCACACMHDGLTLHSLHTLHFCKANNEHALPALTRAQPAASFAQTRALPADCHT